MLVGALEKTHRIAVGTFTWRGKTTPAAIRVHQDGLLLQRLYFADEVQNAAEIDQGAAPKIRDQERTLAERLISDLSGTEFHPENYEDEYRKRLLKAIEQKIAGQEIQRVEGRGAAPNDRPGRDAQGQPRTEAAGEGVAHQVRGGAHAREAAGTAAPRLVACGSTARLANERARPDDGLFCSSSDLYALAFLGRKLLAVCRGRPTATLGGVAE